MNMKVRYKTVWSVIPLVLAAWGLYYAITGWGVAMFVITFVLMMTGILSLLHECFAFDPATKTITVKPLVGPARRFGGTQGGRLEVAGSRIIWVRPDGKRRLVPVFRYQLNRADWDAVVAQLPG
jgi:hypothetical protein